MILQSFKKFGKTWMLMGLMVALFAGGAFAQVTSVAVNPTAATVTKGGAEVFVATATGTGSPAQTFTWEIQKSDGTAYSGSSAVSNGVLTIDANESDASLLVVATSTVTNTVSGTATVTITASSATVTGVAVTPATTAVNKGASRSFSASVAGTGSPSQGVIWSVSGTSALASGTSISATGSLTVAAGENNATLTVTAKSKEDASKTGTATVTVTESGSAPVSVSASAIKDGAGGANDNDVPGTGTVLYTGNINLRLNTVGTITGAPASFNADTGLTYTWYYVPTTKATGVTSISDVIFNGANRNVEIAKSGRTAADGGSFYQLPEGLGASSLWPTGTYKYFAVVSATINNVQDTGITNLVAVEVKTRPVVSVGTISDLTGANGLVTPNGGAAVEITASAKVTNALTTAATSGVKGGLYRYQWFWTNKTGTGGNLISETYAAQSVAPGVDAVTNSFEVQSDAETTLPGVYYYRCEVTYGEGKVDNGESTDFKALSVVAKSNVVTVEVKPTGADGTSAHPNLIGADVTINIEDVTTREYTVPNAIGTTSFNSAGTKLMVDLKTGTTLIATGWASTTAVTEIRYRKIKTTSGDDYVEPWTSFPEVDHTSSPSAGEGPADSAASHSRVYTLSSSTSKRHGVLNAGTYEVLAKVTGSKGSPAVYYEGWRKVLLTVTPKNISGLSKDFKVTQPVDSVFDGKKKTPIISLKDGTVVLSPEVHYKLIVPGGEDAVQWINAGNAPVSIKGCAELADGTQIPGTSTSYDRCTGASNNGGPGSDANYTGDLASTFKIYRMALSVNTVASTVTGKPYDGTDTLSSDNINVLWSQTLPSGIVLEKDLDYKVSGAKFDNVNAGTRSVTNITVRLDEANSPQAKNFTFGAVKDAAQLSTTFSKSGVVITKNLPNKSFLKYTIPQAHYYNGQGRGIGTVDWKSGVTNPNQSPSAFLVSYAPVRIGEDDDLDIPPSKDLPKGDVGEKDDEGNWIHKPGSRDVVYAVRVEVGIGSNFDAGTVYLDGEKDLYTIHARAMIKSIETKPSQNKESIYGTFIDPSTEDTTVYVGMPLSLKVTPVRPDSLPDFYPLDADGDTIRITDKNGNVRDSVIKYPFKGGTFAYQWYKVAAAEEVDDPTKWTALTSTSAKTDTYTLPQPLKATAEGVRELYQCRVIYTYAAQTVPDTQFISDEDGFREIRVKIGAERKDLMDAAVTVTGGPYSYTGYIYRNSDIPASEFSVTVPGVDDELSADNQEFTYEVYGLNAGKGAGIITVTGINAYKGTAVGYFDIDKIETDPETHLNFSSTKQYNDSVQEFSVTPIAPYSGLGKVNRVYLTRKADSDDEYDTLPGAPKDVGSYVVSVAIDEGLNFTKVEEFKKDFNIVKRVLTKADFIYTSFPDTQAYTGDPLPLVTATLKASVVGYTNGYSVVLLQGNTVTDLTEMPTAEGAYLIYVSVEGDDNFANAMVLLGQYVIADENWVGVKGANRVIPATPAVKVVSVAPVKAATAATFTAGPSPVSKASGKIAFFSTKSVKSGSLYIFDASGNAVAKLSAKAGTGEVASWNLKDKKGVVVAEGTYVVKGALAGKDGTREKVSFVFSVVK